MTKNVIYQIVNTVTGIRYIGQASCFKRRKKEHIRKLQNQKHENIYLQRSYNKYGSENFIFEIIDQVRHAEELEHRENYWFSKYDFDTELYNMCPVAGSTLGKPSSKETKEKLCAIRGGENNPMFGVNHTTESKTKMAENREDNKSVVQLDKDTGETVAIYDSIREAARQTKTSRSNVSKICNQTPYWSKKNQKYYILKTAGGFKWAFLEEHEVL